MKIQKEWSIPIQDAPSAKLRIELDIEENVTDEERTGKILSSIAKYSHEFYLEAGRQLAEAVR